MNNTQDVFRITPRVIAHLGESLIKNESIALLELVKNSYDADATVCDVFFEETQGKISRIIISDNGCGIKDEDKAKVFFPNFTTKSSGMGVGLSVSQDVIQAMGGSISFTSKVGNGTVFTIDIPILKEI